MAQRPALLIGLLMTALITTFLLKAVTEKTYRLYVNRNMLYLYIELNWVNFNFHYSILLQNFEKAFENCSIIKVSLIIF